MNIKPANTCDYDIVSLGEVMLRLDPGDRRIHTTRSFDVWEGGGEYNVARGLRRCFGLRAALATAFVDNPVGRLLEDFILQGGVDVNHIKWYPHDGLGRTVRNGLNFTERGFGARGALGCGDRGNTASSKLKPGDIPAPVRDAAIRKMVELYFPPNSVLVTGYGYDMLYAGPREAVFHAQVRKNYGITHFIVGRDHAGVGNYYGSFDAQHIFADFKPGELGDKPSDDRILIKTSDGRIQSLTLDLTRLQEKYKAGHPEVQKVQVQLEGLGTSRLVFARVGGFQIVGEEKDFVKVLRQRDGREKAARVQIGGAPVHHHHSFRRHLYRPVRDRCGRH